VITLTQMTFRQFLEMKFLAWQQEIGGRRTVLEFAEYLGVSQQTVSSWWNNTRQPQGENVRKVSEKLGLEVYDVLGLPRPDPDLHYLQSQWDTLTAEERRALREQAEQYTTKNEERKPARKQRSATS
jgi:transcriptional regulator with XRE-family HTH domain